MTFSSDDCKTILAERENRACVCVCMCLCVVLNKLLMQKIPDDCWATSQQSLLQDQKPTSLNCSLVVNSLKKRILGREARD